MSSFFQVMKREVLYTIHKSQPLVPVLIQMNLVQSLTVCPFQKLKRTRDRRMEKGRNQDLQDVKVKVKFSRYKPVVDCDRGTRRG